jgi:hypothetical protein
VVDVNADLSASTFASISSGAISSGQIDILAQAELRLQDTTGGQYVGFKAPGTVSSSYTLTLPTATGSAGQTLVTNGSGVLSFATAGLTWQSVQTTGFTAVKGNAYPCDTTSAAFTVTLPATPSAGDQVQVVDYAGTFDTNALVIDPNGEDIEGGTDNLQLIGEREGVILTYIDSTQGWIATSGINEGTDALEPVQYTADFLVIAGGGGAGRGGGFGGGGGAGGYRNSFSTEPSGGGGSSEASLTFTGGTVYTITVGAGGAGGTTGNPGSNGVDSSISGSGISTITSTGGGGGGRGEAPGGGNVVAGNSGGSGGGAGEFAGSYAGTSSGTANQGFGGGASGPSSPGVAAGGGGGAGEAGNTDRGGDGGDGLASSITGSSTFRGGGGAGCGTDYTPTGGDGGGANAPAAGVGLNGTVNTGGGASGGRDAANGGAGGKGVVILRMPTAFYSGTTTGSPTVTPDGTDTVLIFNDSGSYTG